MSVFIVGATGYIGSHVARRLIADGEAVVGMVRTPEAAARATAAGLRTVQGDVGDLDLLQREALAADAVVFAPMVGYGEERAAVTAILQALEGTGKGFLFTSGTGVLAQRTGGDWSEDSFAEDDAFQPLGQLVTRVETERMVLDAARRGVRAMVIRPPAIVGPGHHWHEAIIRRSIETTGAACYIGAGLNITTSVHMDDLADLYALILAKGAAGATYHASAGEVTARVLAETVAAECGCGTRSLTMDEAIETLGRFETLMVMGVCSRSRSPNSRALGWKPRHLDMLEAVRGRGPNPAAVDPKAF